MPVIPIIITQEGEFFCSSLGSRLQRRVRATSAVIDRNLRKRNTEARAEKAPIVRGQRQSTE